MAIWQFDIAVVPISALAADPNLFANSVTPDGIETASWWADFSEEPLLDNELGEILPKSDSWHDNLSVWGDEDGDRIDLFREKGVLESLSIRIDARGGSPDFLEAICSLATLRECKFYGYESASLIEPTPLCLRTAIRDSGASKFVTNPRRYLTEIAEKPES